MGGSMDSPVATELGLAASDAGYVSLRFNWRGVGASAGKPSGEIADADADCRAALDFMRESVEGGIVACGYSWGSLAVFRTCTAAPRVKKLVLVAPPPAMLERAVFERSGRPTLIVTGDRDTYVPLDALRELVAGLEQVELVVLPGVDHFFMAGLGRARAERAGVALRGLTGVGPEEWRPCRVPRPGGVACSVSAGARGDWLGRGRGQCCAPGLYCARHAARPGHEGAAALVGSERCSDRVQSARPLDFWWVGRK